MLKFLFSDMNQSLSSKQVSFALLILRLVTGAAFVMHGTKKIINPFDWMGADSSVPSVFQALAALAEFGGGLALIFGVLTSLASLGILSTMIVAAYTHLARGDSFIKGYELALIYLTISLLLTLTGPGRFSVDALIQKKLAK